VVAENPVDGNGVEINPAAGTAATAFAATVSSGSTPAQLLMLSVGVDAQGAVTLPTIVGRCSLGAVVPRKLATIPGGGDRVYLANGGGDGGVSILKSSIPAPADPPAACATAPITGVSRAARSVAVSPQWFDGTK